MPRAALAVLAFLLFAAPARAQAGGGFVEGIDDLPLMAGLVATGEASVFDAPSGRIVETVAEGNATPAAVLSFYAGTLPQLGWRRDGINRYVRESERLVIEFPPAVGGRTQVRFFLSPE
jgi:hypothetical protein